MKEAKPVPDHETLTSQVAPDVPLGQPDPDVGEQAEPQRAEAQSEEEKVEGPPYDYALIKERFPQLDAIDFLPNHGGNDTTVTVRFQQLKPEQPTEDGAEPELTELGSLELGSLPHTTEELLAIIDRYLNAEIDVDAVREADALLEKL